MRNWLRSPTLLKYFVGQHIVNGLSVAAGVMIVSVVATALLGFATGQPATLGALGGLSAHGPSAWGHSGPWLGFSSCESQAGGCKTGHRQRRSTGPRCDSEIRARTPSARAVVKASAEVKALSTTRQWYQYCCCDFSLPCAHRDSVVPVTAELRKRGKKGAMCR